MTSNILQHLSITLKPKIFTFHSEEDQDQIDRTEDKPHQHLQHIYIEQS